MTELIWDGKYDKDGKKTAPLRVPLPFQTVETVNESAQQRQLGLDAWDSGRPTEWRSRLIWGDKKYVLPSLLQEFAGQVDLIYIDPPFDTGADFSFQVRVDGEGFTKEPSIIEQKAYRDTWGKGIDSYLQWFSETVALLRELMAEHGSIFVHLDWHVGHYAKAILDSVFGIDNFRNEIIWWYYNKLQGNVKHLPKNHDVIFFYSKSESYVFNRISEPRDEPIRQQRRVWDKATGTLKQKRDEHGALEYYTVSERYLDDVWRISYLMPADQKENLRFQTQKPEALIKRILEASSKEGDLVLDCFVGSGTTAAVAEKLNRRWIACDLSRFAIHTARKRLLSITDVKPFIVQNLGKYERQLWQSAEFGDSAQVRVTAYRRFILDLYSAQPVNGYTWLHGVKAGRMVHVGAVDSPVSPGDVTQIAREFRKAIGSGKNAPITNGVDVLGWDFAFEINEIAKQQAAQANINMRFLRIPRDVMDTRAVEQGDVKFFELAALAADISTDGPAVTVTLTDFVIPPDDVPEDVQRAIQHWSQWIDYWAVDWDNKGDTFHNEWQSYRTRKNRDLQLSVSHTYHELGEYIVLVKVIDILGNDTTKTIRVEVQSHASKKTPTGRTVGVAGT